MKILLFFNNKGGVGKTTLVYHLSWMFSELKKKTIVLDLDPQSNLTSMLLTQERLEEIFEKNLQITVLDTIQPVSDGIGYNKPIHIEEINNYLGLIIGNLSLSIFEDKLSDAWLRCLNGDRYAFRLVSIFHQIANDAVKQFNAELVLIDVGPNLGAINRVVTISSDYIVVPVAPDLFSLQGIKNLGTTVSIWKEEWRQRVEIFKKKCQTSAPLEIPEKNTLPLGYIILQHSALENKPVKSYMRWADRIPSYYSEYFLNKKENSITIEKDPWCLGLLKHYRSLSPMAMEARKPMFLLRPADGAIGAHLYAVERCYEDFKKLCENILRVI
ncbi:MAG: AAA family ATPase [Chitinispirillaceae bacterium]|nr:AAA family ATPase [Chitinispirillaceae bacterium]